MRLPVQIRPCSRAASLSLRDSLCKGHAVLRVCCANLRPDWHSRPAAPTPASAERHITRKTPYNMPQIRILMAQSAEASEGYAANAPRDGTSHGTFRTICRKDALKWPASRNLPKVRPLNLQKWHGIRKHPHTVPSQCHVNAGEERLASETKADQGTRN